uniref:tyrosine-type recombinase/integrase n=1 Tax=Radiobacillus deserti TaxID=2594883 RepID=UPI002B1ED487|nr:tyrosine-type recombinase/integrase [Radiobacillus deserti]
MWNRVDENLGYSLLLLGLTSGLRFGELVGLTWNDFDFNNNTLTINKTWGYMKRSTEGFLRLRMNIQSGQLKWMKLQ